MPPEPPLGSPAEKPNWGRIKAALGDALLLSGPERARRLEQLAASNPGLRAQLQEYLALEDQAQDFLNGPAPGARWQRPAVPSLGPGARVGNYRIQRILGLGGTSVVYAAEQEQPRRAVALKVLLSAADSPDTVARFAAEAQLLSGLSHPGIAKVYEGGTHREAGALLPWFAMELVQDARPITNYACEELLDRRARLELLIEVCAAVAHGHQRGVIHRDLKPANVLVDGAGRARVIDFGVAKLLGTNAPTAATLPGSFLGTLACMSPEQANGDAQAVDTRSDVYSLGVLAYELLCGSLPYDLEQRPLAEALATIAMTPPRRPSTHGVVGDLEAVLLKALEKSPERRYPSAAELGADLGRTLADEPVVARPPSFAYHARLFVRRHRLAVLSSLGAVALLLGTVIGTTVHTARVEARARASAEEVKDFLLSVLELTGPGQSGRHDLPVRDLLDRAAARIDQELAGNPMAALEVHATVGNAYRELGLYAEAERHMRRTVALGREVYGARSFERACAWSVLSDVLLESGQGAAAERVLHQAHEVFSTQPDVPAFFVAIVTKKLGEALRQQGKLVEAEEYVRRACATYEATFGPDHEAVARSSETLARVLLDQGHGQAALEQVRRAMDVDLANHGAGTLTVARTRALLADVLDHTGRLVEAGQERRQTLADLERLVPAEHALLLEVRRRAH